MRMNSTGSTGDDEPDVAIMTKEEVDAELKRRGIDVGPAWAKVKAALSWARVKEAIELHTNPKPKPKTIFQLVGEYANAVGRYGPESEQVRQFRVDHADDSLLMDYADALDRLKRRFSETQGG